MGLFLQHAAFSQAVILALCALPFHRAAGDVAGNATPAITIETYKSAENRDLRVWIHRPKGVTAQERRPALVMIHGGGWVGGAPTVFDSHARHFADRGLVCLVIEYRLLDRKVLEPPTLCIQDARSAVRWTRAHADRLGIDATRIGALGASAGGHLAAFLGMMDGCDDPGDDLRYPARVQAMLLLNPVIHNGPGPWGYGFRRTAERYREFSPFHNVTKTAAPTLIMVGTEDPLVPVAMIREFAAAMRREGVQCQVEEYAGQAHSFFAERKSKGRYFRETLAAMAGFLEGLGWLKSPT